MAVPHATDIRDHWYWRPGWGIGSRFYTWHITFDGQPEVEKLADQYRSLLSSQPSLDVIPNRWLHLTMQGIGFVQDVATEDVDAIVAAASDRCSRLSPFELTFGTPHVDPESIQIAVDPIEPVRQVRAAIRAAIADVWGAGPRTRSSMMCAVCALQRRPTGVNRCQRGSPRPTAGRKPGFVCSVCGPGLGERRSE